MARAISSLPTPDWPSISTGMAEPAAFSAVRSTACMRGLRVMMSLKVSVPGAAALDAEQLAFERARRERVAQAHLEPLGADRLDHEVGRARAHGRDHIVDAAMGGLHDHRDRQARRAHLAEHAEPVEIGHHEVEHDRIDARVLGAGEQRGRRIAALGHDRLVARARDHVFQEPPLHRIVIDDENTLFGPGSAGSAAPEHERTIDAGAIRANARVTAREPARLATVAPPWPSASTILMLMPRRPGATSEFQLVRSTAHDERARLPAGCIGCASVLRLLGRGRLMAIVVLHTIAGSKLMRAAVLPGTTLVISSSIDSGRFCASK